MLVNRHTQAGSERVTPSWQFESLTWGISSGFPLANHVALPGSEFVFGLSQGPHLCACASLSQDGFQRRSLRVGGHRLLWGGAPSLLTPRSLSAHV